MRLFEDLRGLSTNKGVISLIGASALSAFGDWLYLAALPIIVYQATHDAALVGLAAAGRLVPFLLLSVPAGAVADRFERRTILLVTESSRIALMVAMGIAYVAGLDLLVLMTLALVANAAGTFAMPAQGALMPQLTRSDSELGTANAASSTLDNLASILGPIVTAILVAMDALAFACAINAFTFAMVVWLLVRIHPEGQVETAAVADDAIAGGASPLPDASAAVRWAAVARIAVRPLLLDAAISFAAGASGVLTVLIAVEHLQAGEPFSAVLSAAGGAGAVAGGLAAGVLVNGDQRLGLRAGVSVASIAFALIAASTIPVVAFAAFAAAVGSLIMTDTLNITTLQRTMPPAFLGRAFGVLHTSAAMWLMAGSAIPPLIANLAGVSVAVLVTGAVVAVLGGASLLPLRRAEPLRQSTDPTASRAHPTGKTEVVASIGGSP